MAPRPPPAPGRIASGGTPEGDVRGGGPSSRGRPWLADLAGLGVATAVALIAVWHLAETDRGWLLYTAGDSVLPALVRNSMIVGEPQQWALSSVLFLPEFALYDVIAAFGWGVRATLAVNAVVNLVLLYCALRAVAGLTLDPKAPHRTFGALTAFCSYASFTLLDSSAAWDGFELPSLIATTTYYSSTVLAAILATGLAGGLLEPGGARGERRRAVGLLLLSAAATLTNPLYLAWAAVPIVAVAAALVAWRVVPVRSGAVVTAALAVGAAGGLLGRIPFATVIVRDPGGYVDPPGALATFVYFLDRFLDRASSGAGFVSLAAIAAIAAVDVVVAVHLARRRRIGPAVLAAVGFVAPVIALMGSTLLGAGAIRYLQPLYFAPLASLVLVRPPLVLLRAVAARRLRVVAGVLLTAAGATAAGLLGAIGAREDPDLACLDTWITTSGRTGAGLFETIRGPKAYLPDPRRLLQVDTRLRAQMWLTDRADYSVRSVSFLVADSTTPPFVASAGRPSAVVRCGRYRILDYRTAVVPVTVSGPIVPPQPAATADTGRE